MTSFLTSCLVTIGKRHVFYLFSYELSESVSYRDRIHHRWKLPSHEYRLPPVVPLDIREARNLMKASLFCFCSLPLSLYRRRCLNHGMSFLLDLFSIGNHEPWNRADKIQASHQHSKRNLHELDLRDFLARRASVIVACSRGAWMRGTWTSADAKSVSQNASQLNIQTLGIGITHSLCCFGWMIDRKPL